jgi:DNA-binding MarR family transcriptional regulator
MKKGLTKRELKAWQPFVQLLEVLRSRIERQLQADSGLSVADYAVLSSLTEAPGGRLRAYELSHELGWDKSRLHHQLTRMANRGLIQREAFGSRGVIAAVTTDGWRTIEKAAPAHAQQVRRLFVDRLTPAKLDELGDISRTLLESLLADEEFA